MSKIKIQTPMRNQMLPDEAHAIPRLNEHEDPAAFMEFKKDPKYIETAAVAEERSQENSIQVSSLKTDPSIFDQN